MFVCYSLTGNEIVAELNINGSIANMKTSSKKYVEDKTDEFSFSILTTHVFVQVCNCNSLPARAYQAT